jgi:hypothetical protein
LNDYLPLPASAVKGKGLSARRLNKSARALLGAGIRKGEVSLTDLSIRQIAAVCEVCPRYVTAALKTTALEREAILRGLRPLVVPKAKASPEARLAKIVEEIGVDGVLEHLVAKDLQSISTAELVAA